MTEWQFDFCVANITEEQAQALMERFHEVVASEAPQGFMGGGFYLVGNAPNTEPITLIIQPKTEANCMTCHFGDECPCLYCDEHIDACGVWGTCYVSNCPKDSDEPEEADNG
jgi:hypothetical protein